MDDFEKMAQRYAQASSDAMAAYEEREAARKRQAQRDVLAAFGVPKRAATVEVEDSEAILAMRKWAETDSWCLVLSGVAGVGKSIAAAEWLRGYAKRLDSADGVTKRWFRAADLAAIGQYDKEIERIARIKTLVIDDLGVEYGDKKGYSLSLFDRILDIRYSEMLATIITTNLSAAQIAAQYEARIVDRMRDGTWYSFNGTSRRGRR